MSKNTLRTRIYIDGYNLYYGCLRKTPWRWLDPLTLFETHILPSALPAQYRQFTLTDIAIKYFTAEILEAAAKGKDSVASQQHYHKALKNHHQGRIDIVKGYYSKQHNTVKMVDKANPKKAPKDCEDILIWKLEEKQSDVNLALHAYHDAITKEIDQVVIVTNDTDIAPVVEMIKTHSATTVVGVVIPTPNGSRPVNSSLTEKADWVRSHIHESELEKAQFPRVVDPSSKRPALKPITWFAHPPLLADALSVATIIRGSQGRAFKWLEQRSQYFPDQSPLELIERGTAGWEVVMNYMYRYIVNSANDPNTIQSPEFQTLLVKAKSVLLCKDS